MNSSSTGLPQPGIEPNVFSNGLPGYDFFQELAPGIALGPAPLRARQTHRPLGPYYLCREPNIFSRVSLVCPVCCSHFVAVSRPHGEDGFIGGSSRVPSRPGFDLFQELAPGVALGPTPLCSRQTHRPLAPIIFAESLMSSPVSRWYAPSAVLNLLLSLGLTVKSDS
ncbi:hypothetical protein NDU88_004793 [Pleurodeles waltl]|uniref:Uncharacterized protein n=1 Tax=Pleurodeles waltl TaxID=8319 RepID=A0AAV7UG73_PLEWA|nr:hypothetical protein NDU88_004793 [Pleurodeles waltl]